PPRGTTLFALPANPFFPRQPRASAYQAKAGSKRYGASRARSDPLYLNLPVLLGRRPAATRARTRAGDGLSSGRSGVIWSTAHAPGLAPSPGRSALRSAAAVPFKAPPIYRADPASPPLASARQQPPLASSPA